MKAKAHRQSFTGSGYHPSEMTHRASPSNDKRRNRRKSFTYRVSISRGPLLPAVACEIEDVSHSGVRLRLPEDQPLPQRFLLFLSATAQAGKLCEVRWRKGLDVGIEYVRRRTVRR